MATTLSDLLVSNSGPSVGCRSSPFRCNAAVTFTVGCGAIAILTYAARQEQESVLHARRRSCHGIADALCFLSLAMTSRYLFDELTLPRLRGFFILSTDSSPGRCPSNATPSRKGEQGRMRDRIACRYGASEGIVTGGIIIA
ncbi:hypothetical protein BR93DRAFT_927581 [Coniochaeta sp. PMI_546]|nr:hypothetical protein BR93DRAFT_927581 [Coniochaeta sp. PMI_546]